jgi:DNA-binding NtrC family response regulator
MPEMGGIELTEKLREVDPDIRVVLMSGYPLGEDIQNELTTGRLRWIAKPYSAKQLGKIVSDALSD